MFTIFSEPLPDVFILNLKRFSDERGNFNKIFQQDLFASLGIKFSPKEYFYSTSKKNVLRGMHFQVGSFAHDKLVYCSQGIILDVIVDVRKESNYFNAPISIELSGEDSKAVFIGKGYAHGFLTKSNHSAMHYFTSTVHSPENDMGVLWSSINFDWQIKNPVISTRDGCHPDINEVVCEFS